jgi:glycosyltransferase involved in cell wall biosynthesis
MTIDGVNVIGYLRGEVGVGSAARGYVAALESAKIPTALYDMSDDIARDIPGRVALPGVELRRRPYRVNLITISVHALATGISRLGEDLLRDHYNIGTWWWELGQFPEEWHPLFRNFDEIWAGSTFIAQTLSNVSPIPVTTLSPPLPPGQTGDRERGRARINAANDMVFLFVFDFGSSVERKNALAVIAAFNRAFAPQEPARLVIKSANSHVNPAYFRLMQERATGARISLYDGYWSSSDLADLMAAADAYVSLHRAEGLGLTMLEAMRLGKPVVATGWSGNMDFMSPETSYPVRFDLVRLHEDSPPYKAGWLWAEPSLDHAAELMRQIFEHPSAARQVAARGQEFVAQHFSPPTVGEKIKDRLVAIEQRHQPGWRPLDAELAPGKQGAVAVVPAGRSAARDAVLGQDAFDVPEAVWQPLLQGTIDAFEAGRMDEGNMAALALLSTLHLPAGVRELVYWTQAEYAQPLHTLVPSMATHRLTLPAQPSAECSDPSPVAVGDAVLVFVRTRLGNDRADVLLTLDDELEVVEAAPLIDETGMAAWFDDVRLFADGGTLRATLTIYDPDADEWTRGGVVDVVDGRYSGLRLFGPRAGFFHQGWAPLLSSDGPYFLGWWEPVELFRLNHGTNAFERVALQFTSHVAERFWSGSQGVETPEGLLLLVNETTAIAESEESVFTSRFALLTSEFRLTAVSPPFFVAARGEDVATGLALNGDRLIAGFTSAESEALLVSMDLAEVLTALITIPDSSHRQGLR